MWSSSRTPLGAGTNCFEAGRSTRTAMAEASATPPTAAKPHRQPPKSAPNPATSRPAIPPRAVPPMYSPAARAWVEGCSSSRRYAVATAGRPARTRPWSNRSTSSAFQPGAKAQAMATTAEAQRETWMSRVRPTTSDIGPATRRAAPSASVVSDKVSVALVAETSNCAESSGSKPCGLYSTAKVARPATNSATRTRRYSALPGRYPVSDGASDVPVTPPWCRAQGCPVVLV
jgi:hypothetical protein